MALFRQVEGYQEQVLGPDDIYTNGALEKLLKLTNEELSFEQETLRATLASVLASVYPEKAAFTGTEALKLLIESGIRTAAVYGPAERSRPGSDSRSDVRFWARLLRRPCI